MGQLLHDCNAAGSSSRERRRVGEGGGGGGWEEGPLKIKTEEQRKEGKTRGRRRESRDIGDEENTAVGRRGHGAREKQVNMPREQESKLAQ